MSRFNQLIGQDRPRRILTGILASANIPNAFLFTGIDGVGKRTAALWFARAANCTARPWPGELAGENSVAVPADQPEPCGACSACRRILAGSHPDVMVVAPAGDVIKIARIREIIQKIAFKPHQARLRVIIITEAQAMNREASNALLKVLEEPPPQTVFCLTAGQADDLLPTVVSRCQGVRFNPVSAENIAALLAEQHGIEASVAGVAAIVANGSVARALSLVDQSRTARLLARRREWLLDEVSRLPSRSLSLVLAFAERLSRDKQHLTASLEIIGSYLRDLLISRYCPEKILNRDMADKIIFLAKETATADLIARLDAVAEAETALARNANQRLTLEIMAIKLADMNL